MLQNGYSRAICFCLTLALNMPIYSVMAQDSIAPTKTINPDSKSNWQAANDEALRAQLEREGSLQVRVDLRLPASPSQGPEEFAHATWQDNLEQTKKDLLFALPAGTYSNVQRVTDSPSFTLRVDSESLDALLVSPLVAGVDVDQISFTENGEIGKFGTLKGQFKYPQGIAVNQQEREVHVVDNTNKRIQVFDVDSLQFIRSYASDKIFYPIDVAIDKNGNSYVTSYGAEVVYFDYKGIYKGIFSTESTGARSWPEGLFCDLSKNLLVIAGAATENSRISTWRNEELIKYWSSQGSSDVWVSSDSKIWVAAWDKVIVYDSDGKLLDSFPVDYGALSITGDNLGHIFITYYYANKVDAYASDGSGRKLGAYYFKPGVTPKQPYSGHHFSVAYASPGYLFVTNRVNHSVTRLKIMVTQSKIPDFIVTGISLNPATPSINSTFSAKVTVKNQGTASGNGGWLDVWTNQSGATACGSDGIQYKAVGILAAGTSKTFTFSGLKTRSGAKTLRAFVDSYCQTPELNERNNQRTKVYTVQ